MIGLPLDDASRVDALLLWIFHADRSLPTKNLAFSLDGTVTDVTVNQVPNG